MFSIWKKRVYKKHKAISVIRHLVTRRKKAGKKKSAERKSEERKSEERKLAERREALRLSIPSNEYVTTLKKKNRSWSINNEKFDTTGYNKTKKNKKNKEKKKKTPKH